MWRAGTLLSSVTQLHHASTSEGERARECGREARNPIPNPAPTPEPDPEPEPDPGPPSQGFTLTSMELITATPKMRRVGLSGLGGAVSPSCSIDPQKPVLTISTWIPG